MVLSSHFIIKLSSVLSTALISFQENLKRRYATFLLSFEPPLRFLFTQGLFSRSWAGMWFYIFSVRALIPHHSSHLHPLCLVFFLPLDT